MATESEILADVPFFSGLDDAERNLLAERVSVERFAAGTTIFNTGDPGNELYIVRAGVAEVFFKNDTGEVIVLETARSGDFFGEISLLDNGPRTASVRVVEDVEAVVVSSDDLAYLIQKRPDSAMDLLAATGRRLRQTAALLRHTASRNVNEEVEDKRSTVMRVADWISAFSGSLTFLFLHLGFFFVWISANVVSDKPFDDYPFGFLTLVVSLEAIILSVFVLLSQNRQVERDRVRGDIEYDVNLKAELEIAHLHEKVDHMHAEILARLAAFGGDKPRTPVAPTPAVGVSAPPTSAG